MTCVVGLVHDGAVYMGGDSLGNNSWDKGLYAQKKVFKSQDSPDLIIGMSGTYNFQALEYENLLDEMNLLKNNIDRKYLITKFIPRIKEIVNMYNSNVNKNGLNSMEGKLMFGYKDKLFQIQSDYSLLEPVDEYMAIGSGEYFALGSLESTKDLSKSPIQRIHLALKSASKFGVGVGAPFYIINTANDDVIELKE